MKASSVFDDIPTHLPEELIETLAGDESVRIERIVSRGHCSPEGFWYNQKQNEWVILLTGSARVSWDDAHEPALLRPGDYLHIPARRRHRIDWTAPERDTVWLAVFYG